MPLTDADCRNAKPGEKPRKLSDTHSLHLLVKPAGKYWRWDYRHAGKRKTMALGVYPEVGLKAARERVAAGRGLLAQGQDPMQERAQQKQAQAVAAANSFKAVALDWHAGKAKRWVAVTAAKTLTHLETDVFPVLGARPVSAITPPELLAVLRKVEGRGAAYTATRLREICGSIFRFAIATGRATYNPAADLTGTIVKPKVKHRPAITDRREFGAFLRHLKNYGSADRLTLLATRLALLTFVRSQELRYAEWGEIDYEAGEWRVPAGRMKMGKGLSQAHIVPLSREAVDTLKEIQALTGHPRLVLPSQQGEGRVMSENTIGILLKRMGYKDRQTLHGFRASARSLLSERGWSEAALERQLDHAERDAVVAAYARSQHLDERRRLMADWGRFVAALEAGENVIPLRKSA